MPRRVTAVTDNLREEIRVVVDLMGHIATDIEKYLQKFRTPVHGGQWSVVILAIFFATLRLCVFAETRS